MSTEYYSHGRYRTEVWEGTPVTNWGIGESKRKPTEVLPSFSLQGLEHTNLASMDGVSLHCSIKKS